jgi:protein phosphatase
VDLANLRGGPDNITVVIARVGPIPPELPQEPELDDDAAGEGRYGWGWLIGLFLAGALFILGTALPHFDRHMEGLLLEVLGAVGLVALFLAWLRGRRQAAASAGFPKITPGTPYRTASAKITPEFVGELASLEHDLQRTAVEEGWSIEWTEHNRVFESARTAFSERRYPESLRDYARVIHILMAGIHLLRRQRDQLVRWGSRASPKPEEGEGK